MASDSSIQLMSIGMFIFGLDTMAYSDLQRRMSWRHATTERFGARPARQFTGPGDDSISLQGRLVPEMGAQFASIAIIQTMAATGDDWPMIDGLGRVLGHYCITALDQTHIAIMAGGLPRVIDFTLQLERAE